VAAKKIMCTGYLQCIIFGAVYCQYYINLNWAAYLVQKRTATSRRPVPVVTEDSPDSSEEEEGVKIVLCAGYLQCIILGSVISIISSSELGCLFGSEEDCYSKQEARARSYRGLLRVLSRGGGGIKIVSNTGYLQCIVLGSVISIISSLNWAVYLVQKRTATSRRPVPVVSEDSSESSEEEEEA
jgi:hypothetical protein